MFDHLSAFQTAKEWLTIHTGLSKDALHIYVGLLLLLGSARLFRWHVGDWRPFLVVAAFALAGEAWDIRDVLMVKLALDPWANWHDIWNTSFWPLGITVLARHSGLFAPDDMDEKGQ